MGEFNNFHSLRLARAKYILWRLAVVDDGLGLHYLHHAGQSLLEIRTIYLVAQHTVGAHRHGAALGQALKGKFVATFIPPTHIGYDVYAFTLQSKGYGPVAVGVPELHDEWQFTVQAEIGADHACKAL